MADPQADVGTDGPLKCVGLTTCVSAAGPQGSPAHIYVPQRGHGELWAQRRHAAPPARRLDALVRQHLLRDFPCYSGASAC
ncbi:MAG: hypothetical protein K0S19_1366, partial [Geminicoccaceae bacterium]|nr:hypothetical protein [Geminicoccaceae bacterium]